MGSFVKPEAFLSCDNSGLVRPRGLEPRQSDSVGTVLFLHFYHFAAADTEESGVSFVERPLRCRPEQDHRAADRAAGRILM